MLAYLYGNLILALFWLFAFISREDLRKPMLWTGMLYSGFTILGFAFWAFLSRYFYLGNPITPGYWNPDTLLNLSRITGGLAIEDVTFMLFVGGIVTWCYEYFTNREIKVKKIHNLHYTPFLWAFLAFILALTILKVDLIYTMFIASFTGAFFILKERPDLTNHALLGGTIFLGIYVLLFKVFLLIFPNYVSNVYNISILTGNLI